MDFKCDILAKLMVEAVYPRLVELMSHNATKEIKVVVGTGYKNVIFTKEGIIKWLNTNETVSYTFDYRKGKNNKCPAAGTYENSEKYVEYCNLMMDKIPELEKGIYKFDQAIERAGKIGVMYVRQVLFEKTLIFN